ncbi:MAG: gamma-glutamyltransferase [Candidatus Dormibacter sp.]
MAVGAFTTRPQLEGTFGMVASTHWLASAAGMAVLERGGNAFDAAAAAGFVLQVAEPHLNGPGGDMPALVYSVDRKRVEVVCGQGTAPAGLTVDHVRGLGLEMIPGTGLLAPCIPGAVGGWLLMLAELGTWRLADVLEFAIGYAEGGIPVLPRIAAAIAGVADLFRTEWPSSAAVYLREGLPAAGSLFRNPVLAATYRRLLAEAGAGTGGREAEIERARRAFYEGFVAEAIDRFCRQAEAMDVSGRRHRAALRGADLAGWRAGLESSLSRGFSDYEVHKTAAWGQGPVFLQQLALLEAGGLEGLEAGSAELVHRVVEAAKLAFADREAWYGDEPDVPLAGLLSTTYAGERARLEGDRASLELRPGHPDGRTPRLPHWAAANESGAGIGDPTNQDTCHVDVADRWGNLVSATPSGGWLQSSPAVPALGFPLGTRAQIFNLDVGSPNALRPGKRPRTTLSPSLAFRAGEPYMAFGTPGADAQDQWAFNFFINHAVFGLNLQEAIDAVNWRTLHFPDSFYPHAAYPGRLEIEVRAGATVIDELRRRDHEVVTTGEWSQGRVSAVARETRRRVLLAAANPRGMQGYAVGR